MDVTSRAALLALAALLVTGCGRHGAADSAATSTAPAGPATSSAIAGGGPTGDAGRGRGIFAADCAACHGATGTEGGVGPSLRHERTRKNADQTIAWIDDPTPPMPKLYPGTLTQKDVDDVAAYVLSL